MMSTTQQDTATGRHKHISETSAYQGYETVVNCLYSAANVNARWQILKLNCQNSYFDKHFKIFKTVYLDLLCLFMLVSLERLDFSS